MGLFCRVTFYPYNKMRLLSSILAVATGLLASVCARSASGDRVLVVLEESVDKSLYSQFWTDLEERQFSLTFASPKSEGLDLFRHGELTYDHVILTPPKSKGYGPSLTPKRLLDFTNAGGNILLGLSADLGTPSAITSLLLEFDIAIPSDRSSVVVDHFNYDTASVSDQHDVLVLSRPKTVRSDVTDFFGGSGMLAMPHCVAQSLGNTNPLIAPILRAPSTAYVHNPKEEADSVEELFATGSQISLITAMQARNSARFTVLGSLEMLQNTWFGASVKGTNDKEVKTVNKQFARQLTEWAFKEVGVLKASNVEHHEITSSSRTDASTKIGFSNPTIYRIKNDVSFCMEISTWDRTQWAPYIAPAADAVQLEFSMLSPFQRLPLTASSSSHSNATLYSTTFKLPDQHGIFAFKVNYKRPFLTNIEEKRQVTVRHFAHDEWTRSWRISGAWPWITGLWSVVGGFLAFVGIWLYCEPPKQQTKSRQSL